MIQQAGVLKCNIPPENQTEKKVKFISKSEVAKIAGVSPSYISKVIAGEIKGEKSDLILFLLDSGFDQIVKDLLTPQIFSDMCELVITKAKSDKKGVEMRKHAVKCQNWSEFLRRNLI